MRWMEKLRGGLSVFSVNDLRLGDVTRVNACCFGVSSAAAPACLKLDAIFNIDFDRVTLICGETETARYRCGLHQK